MRSLNCQLKPSKPACQCVLTWSRALTLQLRGSSRREVSPVLSSPISRVVLGDRGETGEDALAFHNVPDNRLFVWGQPFEVDDQIYCCGFGKVHHLIECSYRSNISLRRYCLIPGAPDWSRPSEDES